MDTIDRQVCQLEDMLDPNTPWRIELVDLRQEMMQFIQTEIDEAVRATRDHILEQTTKDIQVLQAKIDTLVTIIQALPSTVRAALENMPDVKVEIPQPRLVEKTFEYDEQNRPSRVYEKQLGV